jgi:uncharacterized membrane protein YhaH (DUF805 family)
MAVKKAAAKRVRTAPQAGQNAVLSTVEWFGTLIVLIVPIVGLVVYLIWAFGSGGNINRRNYCRAALIMMAISLVFSIIFSVVLGSIIGMLTQGFGIFQ